MSTHRVLVTDSLFVPPGGSAEARLEAARCVVHRIDKEKTPEDELIAALQDADGYILGGVETVTERVAHEAGPALRGICFTGSGYAEHIPSYETLTQRGIAVTASAGSVSQAAGEYTIALALMAVRSLANLLSPNGPKFVVARELSSLRWGVIGYGQIGRRVARLAGGLGCKVVATARHVTEDPEIQFVDLATLVADCDVISIHVDKVNGQGALSKNTVTQVKSGAIIVNTSFDTAWDEAAVLQRTDAGSLIAVFDGQFASEAHRDLKTPNAICFRAQNGFATQEAIDRTSNRAVTSMINLLENRPDPDIVNPEYSQHRP